MAREFVHKKIKPGTLVLLNSEEVGIVTRVTWHWGHVHWKTNDPHYYRVLVRGREVSVCREGLTIIGES